MYIDELGDQTSRSVDENELWVGVGIAKSSRLSSSPRAS